MSAYEKNISLSNAQFEDIVMTAAKLHTNHTIGINSFIPQKNNCCLITYTVTANVYPSYCNVDDAYLNITSILNTSIASGVFSDLLHDGNDLLTNSTAVIEGISISSYTSSPTNAQPVMEKTRVSNSTFFLIFFSILCVFIVCLIFSLKLLCRYVRESKHSEVCA